VRYRFFLGLEQMQVPPMPEIMRVSPLIVSGAFANDTPLPIPAVIVRVGEAFFRCCPVGAMRYH